MTRTVAGPPPTSGPRNWRGDPAAFFPRRSREAQERGPPTLPLPDSVGRGRRPPRHRPPPRGRSAPKLTGAGRENLPHSDRGGRGHGAQKWEWNGTWGSRWRRAAEEPHGGRPFSRNRDPRATPSTRLGVPQGWLRKRGHGCQGDRAAPAGDVSARCLLTALGYQSSGFFPRPDARPHQLRDVHAAPPSAARLPFNTLSLRLRRPALSVITCALCVTSQKSLPEPRSPRASPVPSFKSFIILVCSFRSFIHFDQICPFHINPSFYTGPPGAPGLVS